MNPQAVELFLTKHFNCVTTEELLNGINYECLPADSIMCRHGSDTTKALILYQGDISLAIPTASTSVRDGDSTLRIVRRCREGHIMNAIEMRYYTADCRFKCPSLASIYTQSTSVVLTVDPQTYQKFFRRKADGHEE